MGEKSADNYLYIIGVRESEPQVDLIYGVVSYFS